MKKIFIVILGMVLSLTFCGKKDQPQNKKIQGISLLGKLLYSARPSEVLAEKHKIAEEKYEKNPHVVENIIWFGRRTAYLGEYKMAIQIFTEGIKKFPEDPRLYRHRGHRYISIRKFDKAIDDFKKAVKLTRGQKDRIEPDGMPNARNIPVSTLQGNIWYHLGLACYLKNDLKNALAFYKEGLKVAKNNDSIVSIIHWNYMALRRLREEEEAKELLKPVHAKMDIIENMAYHKLCLFYKGEIKLENLTGPNFSSIMNDAVLYGIGNWYLYNGKKEQAKEVYLKILAKKGWASFGYIAAEADFARIWKK